MVSRKPVPTNMVPAPLSQAASNPPYPTSPTMPSQTRGMHPGYEDINPSGPSAPNGSDSRSRTSSVSSHGTWNSEPSEPEEEQEEQSQMSSTLQQPLEPEQRALTRADAPERELPDSLRPGPIQNTSQAQHQTQPYQPNAPQSQQQPLHDHNPYLNPQNTGRAPFGTGSRMSVWGEASPQLPTHAPPPPPGYIAELSGTQSPTEELGGLSLGEQENQAWTSESQSTAHPEAAQVRPVPTGRSHSSNPWQEDLDREQQKHVAPPTISQPPEQSLLDDSGPPIPPKSPSRRSPAASPKPPTIDTAAVNRAASGIDAPETPGTRLKKQRNEFYHIKHVNWYDTGKDGKSASMRRSPILTQNANGPCPLLALVNALSLSTPVGTETTLTETLRAREQITLGLLLDAVFEELVRLNETSERDLPDISDLYSFLITLHTGMNVNPRFADAVGTSETPAFEAQPGNFEQTREMRLYGAFGIPLVHGWTSPVNSDVYQAFSRSAPTFDEALNIQFRQEELEEKVAREGLNNEEQQMFEDVITIKQYLANFPTQLSDYGLNVISKWMSPGQIAILFRNDHFSTLYKEPKTGNLMTLVTDTGYSTHDEIVWESLVDVNGAASDLFSGDFRPVGNNSNVPPVQTDSHFGQSGNVEAEWQTVQSRKSRKDAAATTTNPTIPAVTIANKLQPPAQVQRTLSEQEDHDLALALQLQEEEEDNNRRERERRQREDNLSREYLENEQNRPALPARRTNTGTAVPVTPGRRTSAVNVITPTRRTQFNSSARTDDSQAPPPTYEQAASDRPYREPGSAPDAPEQGNPLGALSALDAQRQQSAFAAQGAQYNRYGPGGAGPSNMRRPIGTGRGSRQSSAQYPGQYPQGGPDGTYGYDGTPTGYNRNQEEKCIMM